MEKSTQPVDDRLTMAAISLLAYILGDLLHEGVGHGLTAWFSGAHSLTMSTVALSSDIATRWISANGTLVNLVAAPVLWLVLKSSRRLTPEARYFLVLAIAGNLFEGTGYFLFSGVMNFGDWAAVIQGQEPYWLWRTGLVILGVVTYYTSMLVVAAGLRPFHRGEPRRLMALCFTPYFAQALLAAVAGLLNPAGLFYVLAAALPSTLGANAGFLALPGIMAGRKPVQEPAGPIRRSLPWVVTGAVAALLFIFVLGRGLSWSR